MHVREMGRGPAVVLIHGMPSAAEDFIPLARALAERHRVLIPDLPGYGATPALARGAYTMDAVQAALEDALLARGVKEAAAVGHSGGGYRALGLALSGRVRLTALALLGATPGPLEEERAGWHGFATALRGGADLSEMFVARVLPEATRAAHPEWVERVKGWIGGVSGDALADELAAFGDAADLRPRLHTLRIPVVARVGALDLATPSELSAQIVHAIEGARLEVVPGCGHALLMEDEAATIASVMSVLR